MLKLSDLDEEASLEGRGREGCRESYCYAV